MKTNAPPCLTIPRLKKFPNVWKAGHYRNSAPASWAWPSISCYLLAKLNATEQAGCGHKLVSKGCLGGSLYQNFLGRNAAPSFFLYLLFLILGAHTLHCNNKEPAEIAWK